MVLSKLTLKKVLGRAVRATAKAVVSGAKTVAKYVFADIPDHFRGSLGSPEVKDLTRLINLRAQSIWEVLNHEFKHGNTKHVWRAYIVRLGNGGWVVVLRKNNRFILKRYSAKTKIGPVARYLAHLLAADTRPIKNIARRLHGEERSEASETINILRDVVKNLRRVRSEEKLDDLFPRARRVIV